MLFVKSNTLKKIKILFGIKLQKKSSLHEKCPHTMFFSGPYFPIFELNTEIYSVNLCIQSEWGKIWTRKNFVFGNFSPSAWYY